MEARKTWHEKSIPQVIETFHTDKDEGLTKADASARLSDSGLNEIQQTRQRNIFEMFIKQFQDFMILILLAAAAISGFVGEIKDSIVIMIIVILNGVIGVFQEYRAEHALSMLRKMENPSTMVLRDGLISVIPTRTLVAGDIVNIEAGNVIPADLRLIEEFGLQVDESALTGESAVVSKQSEILQSETLAIGDQSNMAWKGTLVSNGRATGIVVATGMETELGRIAALLRREAIQQTPLQKRLARFGRYLAIVVLVICAIIFTVGVMQGAPLLLMFLTAISLAVAAIPEALPAVVTISLSMGAYQISHRHALIRRLPTVEALGSVTYICTDKTGTLTENRMHLETIYANHQHLVSLPDDKEKGLWVKRLGEALAISNDVSGTEDALAGDPTEVALYQCAVSAGFDKHECLQRLPRIAEVPFTSERKRMSTLHKHIEGSLLYSKGAPEALLPRCKSQLTHSGIAAIDRDALYAEADALASQGYRVLAFAYRELPDQRRAGTGSQALDKDKQDSDINDLGDELETELIFLALAALIDPPRAEASQAVAECRTAGITPVMITGDHPGTARAIAERVGISDPSSRLISGPELAALSDQEFEAMVETIAIYARVSPEQKIRIVKTLQHKGQFVAMTGDGVNDAPALKRAEIGIAMGAKGTDVAREAADMVLLDDNFTTIVTAVKQGRRIFDNIRKFIKYTMTSNSGEIWTIFLAPFLGLPVPLLPIHILWINLVTDGLPGLALAAERAEKDIMQRPPRPPKESIFAHGMWQHMLWVGLLIGLLSLGGQAWAIHTGSDNWQTIVFTVLTFSQLFQAMAVRSDTESLFSLGVFTNIPLVMAIALSVALQLAVIYLPFMNAIFNTRPLSPAEIGMCVMLSSVVLVATEIEKWLSRRVAKSAH